MLDEFEKEHENDIISKMLKSDEEQKQKAEEILRKKHPTLEEKKYVLFNEAFGMRTLSSIWDGDRELLGAYLDNVSERTIQRNYKRFSEGRYLTSKELKRIYKSAHRIYNQHY